MVLKSECMFNIKRNEISSQKDSYFQHELVSTKKKHHQQFHNITYRKGCSDA